MVKVEVIEKFDLKDFGKLTNIKRASAKDKVGSLYVGDIFECDEKMADYLTGENPLKRAVVKVIEVKPNDESEDKDEVKSKPTNKKSKKRK